MGRAGGEHAKSGGKSVFAAIWFLEGEYLVVLK